jgi:hypothetical protein
MVGASYSMIPKSCRLSDKIMRQGKEIERAGDSTSSHSDLRSIGGLSVREAHGEGQCDVEASNIAVVEATYRLSNPRPPNCDGLVGHDLGARRKPLPSLGSMMTRKSGA